MKYGAVTNYQVVSLTGSSSTGATKVVKALYERCGNSFVLLEILPSYRLRYIKAVVVDKVGHSEGSYCSTHLMLFSIFAGTKTEHFLFSEILTIHEFYLFACCSRISK